MTTPTPTLRERVRTAIEAHVHRDPGGLVAWVDEDGATEAVLALLADAGGADKAEIQRLQREWDRLNDMRIDEKNRADSAEARLRVAEERATHLETEIYAVRPRADTYDRVCQALGISHDILGFVTTLQARERELVKALCFARSVILSGESMTPQAEAIFDAALTRAPRPEDCPACEQDRDIAAGKPVAMIAYGHTCTPRPETAGEQG